MDAQSDDVDPLCGKEIAGGRYLVERVLGKGGMGTVYVAVQRAINRRVALKLIHRELVGNPEVVGRFLQEMRVTATIEHPHTVRLYDFGDVDGQPFLTTELLHGRTLRDELDRVGAFPQTRLCNVGMQIAKALRAAHAQGVVHRDLKPDNIMLLDSYGERDYVKVLDFGIARSLAAKASGPHTRTGMLLGTPAYMSPEQCEGRAVDGRSDLYSFGIVLFELAAGKPPFSAGNTVPQLLMDHVASPPPDIRSCAAGLVEPVAALIMSLLAKRPENRPASAEAVVAAFAPFSTTVTAGEIAAHPSVSKASEDSRTSVHSDARPARPRSLGLLAALALLVAAASLGTWFFLRSKQGRVVAPDSVVAAVSLPGEPPFPVACVSQTGRDRIIAAATGKTGWSTVPTDSVERILAEARAAAAADAGLREKLTSAVTRCPSSAVARTLLGKALARADQDEAAAAQFEAALNLTPGYLPARFNLAVTLVKMGKEAQAMPLVTQVLESEPGHAGARLMRGQMRMTAGDVPGAIEDFKAYTVEQPQAGTVWAMLGEALAESGDRDGARAAFCRAAGLGIERVRARCPTP